MTTTNALPIVTAAEGLQATIEALQTLSQLAPPASRAGFEGALRRARTSRIELSQWGAEQRYRELDDAG